MALAAADLAVARAGGSVFELAQYGLPAVLIPYPHASADHQTANARWMADAGAAVVLADAELTPQRLRAEVDALASTTERLRAMAPPPPAGRPDAAATSPPRCSRPRKLGRGAALRAAPLDLVRGSTDHGQACPKCDGARLTGQASKRANP